MTVYSYTNKDGHTIDRDYPMGKQPKKVVVDGKHYHRNLAAEMAGPRACDAWPMKSDALAIHPKQVKEYRQALKKKGVSADFTKDGRMILESRGHRRSVLRALNYYDKDGGYGD